MTPLAGRVAIVAGASRGIGQAIAEGLAADGATVVRLARSLDPRRRGPYLDLPCDLTSDAALGAALAEAEAAVGPPDIVVASTGAFSLAPIEQTPDVALDAQLDANLRAPFALVRAVVPGLRRRGGLIVLIGSVADHAGLPGNAAYAATKYALRGMHETLVAELRGSGVRCTLVSPGATDTPLWDPLDPDRRDDLPDRTAMLRPADVADAVRFVATRPAHVHVDWLRIGPA